MLLRSFLVMLATFVMISAVPTRAAEPAKTLTAADLATGKVAPNIEGKDVNGKTIRLNDLRGRIVLIDFFGDW